MNSRNLIRTSTAGLFAAALTFFAPVAFSSDVLRVEGAPVISTKAEAPVFWRSATGARNATAITFRPLPALALKSLQEENSPDSGGSFQAKPLKIGINRSADTEIDADTPFALNWQNIGSGHVARWAVTSPGAKGMRVALRLRALPDVAELRFSGSGEPERIIGVISGKEANALRDDDQIYWTPVTEGETQNIEIYLPSTISTDDVKIRLNAASHLFVSAKDGFDTSGVTKAISKPCNVDVACKHGSLGSAFQNASKAVARMVYTSGIYTYTCSGTLLNNASGSQTPYFWSAAHCVSSQTIANNINTLWFEEASSCNDSQRNPDYSRLTGGAQILHRQASTDTLLLRLNGTPPAGAWFSAWDASPFSSGNMVGIHHPSGDIKKVSTGKGEGRACDTLGLPADISVDLASLSLVSFSEGIVESGSSGSGLFTLSNGSYHLRGGLMGADERLLSPSGCSLQSRSPEAGNASCYSSLNLVYDSVKQWLGANAAPPPPPGPTRQYTGQWYKPDENNWGLTVLLNFPGNARYLFVPWYTYDSTGKASWYIFQGDNWSANDKMTADVYRYEGSPWGTIPFDNSRITNTKVGTATLTFTSATAATFQYNVEGVNRTINLVKLE